IAKPFNPSDLAKLLDTWLPQSPAPQPPPPATSPGKGMPAANHVGTDQVAAGQDAGPDAEAEELCDRIASSVAATASDEIPGEAPVLDLKGFLGRVMNDPSVADNVAQSFLEDTPPQLEKLKTAVTGGDAAL